MIAHLNVKFQGASVKRLCYQEGKQMHSPTGVDDDSTVDGVQHAGNGDQRANGPVDTPKHSQDVLAASTNAPLTIHLHSRSC